MVARAVVSAARRLSGPGSALPLRTGTPRVPAARAARCWLVPVRSGSSQIVLVRPRMSQFIPVRRSLSQFVPVCPGISKPVS